MAKARAGLCRRGESLSPQLEDLRERPDTRMLGSRVEDARERDTGGHQTAGNPSLSLT